MREFYHSPNGDRWFLARNGTNGLAFVITGPTFRLADNGPKSKSANSFALVQMVRNIGHCCG